MSLPAKLTDPWFEAEFIDGIDPAGSFYRGRIATLEGAQGLWLWCPCAHGNVDKAHGLIIPFMSPKGAPPCPDAFGPTSKHDGSHRPRWAASGTGLADLTLSPSVDVGSAGSECWHDFITNGVVT
jgi:hypothetical protein